MNKCSVTGIIHKNEPHHINLATLKQVGESGEQSKPRVGNMVTYKAPPRKLLGKVTEVERNICHVQNLFTDKSDSFIWLHADGTTNAIFDWTHTS